MAELSPHALDPLRELEKVIGECWRLDAFKRFQCVWLACTFQLSAKEIAAALQLHISTVRRIQASYQREGRIVLEGRGNRGGRRRGYLTFEEEAAFLNAFARRLKNGRIRTINGLKAVYETRIGQKVNKTTIYRLLERHGWGNVATRIHEPGGRSEG